MLDVGCWMLDVGCWMLTAPAPVPACLRSWLEMGWFYLHPRASGIPGCNPLRSVYPVVVSPSAPKRPPATLCQPSRLGWPPERDSGRCCLRSASRIWRGRRRAGTGCGASGESSTKRLRAGAGAGQRERWTGRSRGRTRRRAQGAWLRCPGGTFWSRRRRARCRGWFRGA